MSRKPFEQTTVLRFEPNHEPAINYGDAYSRMLWLDSLIDATLDLENAADTLCRETGPASVLGAYSGNIIEAAKAIAAILAEERERRRDECLQLEPTVPATPREAARRETVELIFAPLYLGGDA